MAENISYCRKAHPPSGIIMYRIPILLLLALFVAPFSYAQAPSVPNLDGVLPEQAQRLRENPPRLLQLRIPEAVRVAARGVPEVLTEVNYFEQGRAGMEHTERTTHSYLGPLRHLTTYYQQDRGPELGPYYRMERTYDGQQRLTETRFDHWFDGSFHPTWRSQNSYTGTATFPYMTTHQMFNGSSWEDYERETYTVAESGTYFTGSLLEMWKGAWFPYMRSTLVGSGGGTMYTSEFWGGSEWVNDWRAFIPNLSVPEVVAVLIAVGLMEEDRLGYFLPMALIPDHSTYEWVGGSWFPDARQTSTTHYEGQTIARIETTFEEYFDGAWEASMRLVRIFDLNEDALLDVLELQFPDAEEWSTLMLEEYGYTDTMRMASALLSLVLDIEKVRGEGGPELFPLARLEYEWEEPTTSSEPAAESASLSLDALYPNPVGTGGTVRFQLGAAAEVRLELFDVLGRRLAVLVEGYHSEGPHVARLDATGLPSGTYLVRLQTPEGSVARSVTVAR